MSKIICQRTFTYDVEEVKNSIRDINNDPTLEVSFEEVCNLVYEWAYEDMRSPASRHDLTFVNENNEEIGL
jgi:hypothetical protein